VNNDGGRTTGNQRKVGGGLIDVDANRYALRQSDPIESGINIRKQTAARRTLTIFDPGRDAFNVTQEPAVVAHEFDGNAVVNVNICEFGFLEIAVNMQRGGSNNAERRTARCEIVARSQHDICRDTIRRRQHDGPLQIQLRDLARGGRLSERGSRLAYGGFCLSKGTLKLCNA